MDEALNKKIQTANKEGNEPAYRQRRREEMYKHDLDTARSQGKTYNKMYEDEFQKDKASGALSSEAVKKHQAYELEEPKTVRAAVDNEGVGAGCGVTKIRRNGKASAEMGKSWDETFSK